jgi:hypothetical protein
MLSKKDAKTIRETDICHFSSIANFIAVNPKVKEINVNRFGIKLLNDNFFIIYF